MAQATPRPRLNSSRLTRFLADLAVADVTEGKQSFAERLGLWLDWTDAIALSAAMNAGGGKPDTLPRPPLSADVLAADVARVRRELAESMTTEGVSAGGKARVALPSLVVGESPESAADFTPYRHYYLAHQRAMEANIAPLRTRIRSALADCSPTLSRLAAVDAVLDEALRERERRLFSTASVLLEKHFQRLRTAHQADLAQRQQPDNPECWMQPGGWLARYCRDMQGALLAELDTRLEPVEGLLDALATR